MSVKSQTIDILTAKKLEVVQTVGTTYDNLIAQVQALPEDTDATLQQQIDDLTQQVNDVKLALAADDSELTDEKAKEAKLQARLDAVKAALEN